MKCLRVGKLRRKKVNEVQYKPERYKRIAQCTADDVDATVGNGQTLEKGAHIGRIRRQGQVLQPNDHTHDGCARGAIDAVVVAAVCCCCLRCCLKACPVSGNCFCFPFFFLSSFASAQQSVAVAPFFLDHNNMEQRQQPKSGTEKRSSEE